MTEENPTEFESVVQRKFGQQLVKLRQEKGMSQERLSYISGVSRSYLSGIELGKRRVSLPVICLLAKTLSVHQSELLKFDLDDDGMDGNCHSDSRIS